MNTVAAAAIFSCAAGRKKNGCLCMTGDCATPAGHAASAAASGGAAAAAAFAATRRVAVPCERKENVSL